MKIIVDKNQFSGTHGKSNDLKHRQIEDMGVVIVPAPLPFGDYALLTADAEETILRRGKNLKKQDLVGDIKISVDTKNGLGEVEVNICGKQHGRFRDEVILAKKCGCKLYVLIEDEHAKEVRDVFRWVNPRYAKYRRIQSAQQNGRMMNVQLRGKPPVRGEQLAKAMLTMQLKYGCEFVFAKREDMGRKIIDLLTNGNNA